MKRLGNPPYVCLITEGQAHPDNYLTEKKRIIETVRSACSDGVDLIQVREKALPAKLLLDLVRDAVGAAAGSKTLVVVNDRVDVAVAAGADGVHLPENALPVSVIRRTFREVHLIGVSVHSVESALKAIAGGADLVFFAPVFATPGKGEPTGTGTLGELSSQVGVPVIALGGIDEHNAALTLTAGASGIAAIRSLNDPESRARLLAAVRSHRVR